MSHRILVAEDSAIESMMIERALVSKGYSVKIANNGEEALNILNQEKFDLLITDFFMPGLNGYELLEKLKASHIAVRALVMTASKEDELQLKSLNIGAFDHLQKPLNLHIFLVKVEKALASPIA